MAKARSPGYPAIGLKEAIDKARMIYAKDFQNKVPRSVIAGHMGYKSLNGGSLPILAALNQYGLLDGRGDETAISESALKIIAHDPGIAERLESIREAAFTPELFAELHKKFPDGKASDAAVRSHLIMNKFLPTAVDTVIRSYRETLDLLTAEEIAYKRLNPEGVFQADFQEALAEANDLGELFRERPKPLNTPPLGAGPSRSKVELMSGERVVFVEEGEAAQYLKLIASGDISEDMLEALEDFVKRQKKRLARGRAEGASASDE